MASVVVVGDGPGGLSAALLLAKNDVTVTVVGANTTGANAAFFHNYLGIEAMDGPDFIAVARKQAEAFGAKLIKGKVKAIEKKGKGFLLDDDQGGRHEADYVIYATGRAREMAEALGADLREDGSLVIDLDCRTTVDNLYAVGRVARDEKIQAIISAGDGAVAALDILSKEAGKPVRDWDTRK